MCEPTTGVTAQAVERIAAVGDRAEAFVRAGFRVVSLSWNTGFAGTARKHCLAEGRFQPQYWEAAREVGKGLMAMFAWELRRMWVPATLYGRAKWTAEACAEPWHPTPPTVACDDPVPGAPDTGTSLDTAPPDPRHRRRGQGPLRL